MMNLKFPQINLIERNTNQILDVWDGGELTWSKPISYEFKIIKESKVQKIAAEAINNMNNETGNISMIYVSGLEPIWYTDNDKLFDGDPYVDPVLLYESLCEYMNSNVSQMRIPMVYNHKSWKIYKHKLQTKVSPEHCGLTLYLPKGPEQ